MTGFEVINVDVDGDVRNEVQAALVAVLEAGLKIIAVHVIGGVTGEVSDEADFAEDVGGKWMLLLQPMRSS